MAEIWSDPPKSRASDGEWEPLMILGYPGCAPVSVVLTLPSLGWGPPKLSPKVPQVPNRAWSV